MVYLRSAVLKVWLLALPIWKDPETQNQFGFFSPPWVLIAEFKIKIIISINISFNTLPES